MNRDDSSDERRTAANDEREESAEASKDETLVLVGEYDDVGGAPAFVVADVDRDGAWLAVQDGAECDLVEWC
jgi:hypothetical protein